MNGQTLLCDHRQLRLHPHNMRRFYDPKDVEEMARSIEACGGVVQALIVVPAALVEEGDDGDVYYVVDGNVRLAGARFLGDRCPPLKCEVVSATRAEQLLAMAVTSAFHYPKDPIGEARHYRRLVREEGYPAKEIARHTGLHVKTVKDRLRLLDLDEEIQELVASGSLPRDRRAADALLSIPDGEARVKLARRLARPGVTIKAIVAACARLAEQLEEQSAGRSGVPMVALAQNGSRPPRARARVSWSRVREAAGEMCAACEATANELRGVPEPAWALIAHRAGQTCGGCSLKGMVAVCRECPGVELLSRIISSRNGGSDE